jgi:hypothetical protein
MVIWKTCFKKLFKTQTLVSFKKYMPPSSSVLQGKHLPFSPSPLRLNIFLLFVILSLTQLYRYTPEIFLFSTATFKYIYRAPPQTNWTRIVSECGLLKISVNETDTTTSGLRWIFHMHLEFSRPPMCNNATWSSPLKCKVSL